MNHSLAWKTIPRTRRAAFLLDGCFRTSLIKTAILFGVVLFAGCSRKSENTTLPEDSRRPAVKMLSLAKKGEWEKAWELADTVLAENPDDVESIALVARVAHETDRRELGAELIMKACRAESFGNPNRVHQAMIAMIEVGRLYEGIDFLAESVQQQPTHHEIRRMLYDFLIGTEARSLALVHGRALIAARQFDLDLLMSLNNTGRRTLDAEPLNQMSERYPDDKRPMIGRARQWFDEGKLEESESLLREILSQHQDFLPAYALLCRLLVETAQFDAMDILLKNQPQGIEQFAWYWIAIGQWSEEKGDLVGAARAYWEATKTDPDVATGWLQLHRSLAPLETTAVTASTYDAAQLRATELTRLSQLQDRFERTGKISREIAGEIAESLLQLGRYWESEAWASMAMTLPEDDAVDTQELRNKIIAKLSRESPWQVTDSLAEFAIDLSDFKIPAISREAIPSVTTDRIAASSQGDSGLQETFSLINQAGERGVVFFGRTSKTLDESSIMLHETLGCGGGTIDFDLDGWSDLYLVGAGGMPPAKDSQPNALMRNLEGQFVNVAELSATADRGFGQGCAVGDVNEDGFPDILVLNYGANTLLINNGDGTFRDSSDLLDNNGPYWSASGAIADLDSDGISDIVIVNYCAGLELLTKKCKAADSPCSPVVFPAQHDQFLFGRPEERWIDQTETHFSPPSVPGRGLGVVVGDFDNNPGVDIFAVNDMTSNHYWSMVRSAETSVDASTASPASFQFVESATPRGLAFDGRSQSQGSMGIATADFDRDGDIDFYVTNFEGEYNTYHQQQNPGVWSDVTARTQLAVPTLPMVAFGTQAVDLNHDGNLELLVSNGHVAKLSRTGEPAAYAQDMQLFQRQPSGEYQLIPPPNENEYLSTPHVGRALWTIDANGDGKLDFAVTHKNEPVALLMNTSESSGSWLKLQLVGQNCSRDAIGAIVQVTTTGADNGNEQRWTASRHSGDGYLSSNEAAMHFGIGDVVDRCNVKVRWPDGSVQHYFELEPNQTWLLCQAVEAAFLF